MSILQNEKYKGDALLQKKFTVDFLTKKQKVNEGEVPQYYVEGSHEAIVDADDWDIVQAEIARRKQIGRSYRGENIFSCKLVCADCGGFYGQKVWHSTDAYRRIVWRCNEKYKGNTQRNTPTLELETIKAKFIEAYNLLMKPEKNEGAKSRLLIQELLNDSSEIETELERYKEEETVVSAMIRACIQEKASNALPQDEFSRKYNSLMERHAAVTAEIDRLNEGKEKRQRRDLELQIFLKNLESQPNVMSEWNDRPWITLLDQAKVCEDGRIIFIFKDGTEITV